MDGTEIMAINTPSTAANTAAASNTSDTKSIATTEPMTSTGVPLDSVIPERTPIPTIDYIGPVDPYSKETCILRLVLETDSQLINFRDEEQTWTLQNRNFNRFLIYDASFSFGLLENGDSINLFFLTHDNENRWAEVVVEALGIEVGSKELREVTRNATLDLADDRVCHFRDGRRTRYWYLKHTREERCSIILHYVRISPEWLGATDLAKVLHDNTACLPDWPATLPEKAWTKNVRQLHSQHKTCLEGTPETLLEPLRAARALLPPPPRPLPPSSTSLTPAERDTVSGTGPRFRHAALAISRLRYDPQHSDIEYDVGYEDRFEGMKWIALAKWGGKATEDEAFIPEHRVRQIVRVRDGLVMWDREKHEDRTGEV